MTYKGLAATYPSREINCPFNTGLDQLPVSPRGLWTKVGILEQCDFSPGFYDQKSLMAGMARLSFACAMVSRIISVVGI